MGIKDIVLEYAPVVFAGAVTVAAIGSGAVEGLADLVVANVENVKPAIEAAGVIGVFLPSYYVAKTQCEYIAADGNYNPDI